jgi:hypothetical protein
MGALRGAELGAAICPSMIMLRTDGRMDIGCPITTILNSTTGAMSLSAKEIPIRRARCWKRAINFATILDIAILHQYPRTIRSWGRI